MSTNGDDQPTLGRFPSKLQEIADMAAGQRDRNKPRVLSYSVHKSSKNIEKPFIKTLKQSNQTTSFTILF